MTARFESQRRFQWPTLSKLVLPEQPPRQGWLLIGGYSLLVVGWIGYRLWFQPALSARMSPLLAELLGLVETAALFTLAVLWFALWWYRGQRTSAALDTLNLEHLFQLSPKEFEEFVAQLFQAKGYVVKLRGRSGDRGVDLELVKPGGKRAIVQCKRHRKQIGPKIARELYGTLVHERAAHAFLVTTASISEATRRWARGKSMTLIDGQMLVEIAATLGDEVTKWMQANEPERHTNELRPTSPPPTLDESN